MSEQDIKDYNFLVIAAVEGYAQKHSLTVADVITLFNQHDIISAIRSQYSVLHMLDLDEAEEFAEDMLERAAK